MTTKESIDQAKEQSKNNQEGESTTETNSDKEQLVNVNGEMLPMDEVINGYMRQKDYTKKTQELSKQRKESELSPEAKEALDLLKEQGFQTKDDIAEHFKKENERREREDHFVRLMQANPELASKSKLIKDLADNTGKSYEDVIKEYGIMDESRLQKARSSFEPVGSNIAVKSKEKSINDMSVQEWDEYKKKNGIGTGPNIR